MTSGAIAIPGTLGGRSVTEIGDWAFSDCARLTYVAIPSSVKVIGGRAFDGCRDLSSVWIPNSVTTIGSYAFSGCNTSLFDTATLPGVKLVDGWAVGYEPSLAGILDLAGVRGVGDNAFFRCGNLASVMIPESMGSVGLDAFAWCANLETAYVPAALKGMVEGNKAFYQCNQAIVTYYRDTDWFVMTFDACGGEGGTSSRRLAGTLLTAPIVTRTNFTFEGWSPEVPPTVPAENTTYVAQWTPTTFTVAFNANGGTLPKGKKMAAQTMTYGKAVKLYAVWKKK